MEREDPLHREILEEHARSPLFQGKLEKFSHTGIWQSEKTGNTCKVELVRSESTIEKNSVLWPRLRSLPSMCIAYVFSA